MILYLLNKHHLQPRVIIHEDGHHANVGEEPKAVKRENRVWLTHKMQGYVSIYPQDNKPPPLTLLHRISRTHTPSLTYLSHIPAYIPLLSQDI